MKLNPHPRLLWNQDARDRLHRKPATTLLRGFA